MGLKGVVCILVKLFKLLFIYSFDILIFVVFFFVISIFWLLLLLIFVKAIELIKIFLKGGVGLILMKV